MRYCPCRHPLLCHASQSEEQVTSRCSSAASTSRVHRPLTKAEAELAVITKAEVAAAKGGVLSGADISVVVHAAFVAVPGQTCTR